jgi:signal transduction histidine kinase
MSSAVAEAAHGRLRVTAVCAGIAFGLVSMAAMTSARLLDQPFPGFVMWENGVLAQFYAPTWTGSKAGLPLSSGRIVSLDGRPFPGGAATLAHAASLPAGTPVRYGILDKGTVTEHVVPTMRLEWQGYVSTFGAYLATGVFFFLIALTALHLRPDRPSSRALSLVASSIALVFVLAAQYLSTCRFVVLPLAAEAAAPIAAAHFALVFPIERFTRTFRIRLLAGLALAHGLLLVATVMLFDRSPELADTLALVPNATTALFALATIVGLAQALVGARDASARLQAGIVFAGASAAFVLPAIAVLASVLLDWPISFTGVAAPLSIFPISVLYAVVWHDLLGAERFIRLAVGYTFATSAVVLGYATVVAVLGRSVSTEAAMGPAAGFLLLVVMAISFEPLRHRVQIAIDRVFFRSSVDPGMVLEQSSYELATLADSSDIAARVGERLREALELEWAELSLEGAARSDAAFVEPVRFRDEVLGSLACGAKLSAAPFSSAERDLIRGMAGQAALALHNATSIRQLGEAQAEILRTEHLAAIGEFAGVVTHGLRGPLAGMRAAAQIAREEVAEGSPAAETLKGVLSEADRLDERIRTLLDFSQPRELSRDLVDLREVVDAARRAIAVQAQGQHVDIESNAPEELPRVYADAVYLEECLLELSHNALNAMPAGGSLRFELGTRGPEQRVFVRVSDTGGGIPQGAQTRAFELFYTTREGGTGMGLATVKKSIEQLGGTVTLEHSDEAGTSFVIELPRSR